MGRHRRRVAGLLGLDFLVAARRPQVVDLAEAGWWSAFYIAVALLFAPVLWLTADAATGTACLTGWLVEKSLSVDAAPPAVEVLVHHNARSSAPAVPPDCPAQSRVGGWPECARRRERAGVVW